MVVAEGRESLPVSGWKQNALRRQVNQREDDSATWQEVSADEERAGVG